MQGSPDDCRRPQAFGHLVSPLWSDANRFDHIEHMVRPPARHLQSCRVECACSSPAEHVIVASWCAASRYVIAIEAVRETIGMPAISGAGGRTQ